MAGTDLKRTSLSTALTPHADEGAASGREILLLTDTVPLTVSAEAEYLARRADCTILVIESGATTRAQLRAAASSLQRLDAAAVGFVLNRVSLANADESFRHSVSEVERHFRVQGRTGVRAFAPGPSVVPEAALVSPMRETPALEEKPVTRAVLASPAATPEHPATPEPAAVAPAPLPQLTSFAVVEKWEAQHLPQPAPFMVEEEREAQPLPYFAPFVVAEERETQHLPQPAPFVVAEERETQPLPQPAPAAPAAWQEIGPVSLPVAGSAAQPKQVPIAFPIPERMPVIAEEPKAPPEPEPTPIDLYEAEHVPTPVSAFVPEDVVEEPARQPATQRAAATQPEEETPWWLTEAPKNAETALIQPRAPRVGTWRSAAANVEQEVVAPEVREKEGSESVAPTRLSGLRGILFPLRFKGSDSRKDTGRIADGNGKVDGIGHAPQADATAADPEQTIVIDTVMTRKEYEPVHAKADGTVARGAVPRWVTAEPEFLPPRLPAAEKDENSRATKKKYDQDPFDDIQILPARRGQYRR